MWHYSVTPSSSIYLWKYVPKYFLIAFWKHRSYDVRHLISLVLKHGNSGLYYVFSFVFLYYIVPGIPELPCLFVLPALVPSLVLHPLSSHVFCTMIPYVAMFPACTFVLPSLAPSAFSCLMLALTCEGESITILWSWKELITNI